MLHKMIMLQHDTVQQQFKISILLTKAMPGMAGISQVLQSPAFLHVDCAGSLSPCTIHTCTPVLPASLVLCSQHSDSRLIHCCLQCAISAWVRLASGSGRSWPHLHRAE